MPRYALTIAYDGSDFCGWQKQEPPDPALHEPSAGAPAADSHAVRVARELGLEAGEAGRIALRTVQAVVERGVREAVREPIVLQGASRTDSGVHARGQVAAFTSEPDDSKGVGWPESRGLESLTCAINSRLPEDVMVVGARVVPERFNPIGDCTSKGYSYTYHLGPRRPLFDRRYVFHFHHHLDEARMNEACGHIVGEHDFAAFAAADHGRLSTVRTVFQCAVTPESCDTPGGMRLRLDISGNGFLYNMVRIIAGTLLEVGRGKIEPSRVAEIIAARQRRGAGATLPPEGLCLEWITYAGLNEPGEQ